MNHLTSDREQRLSLQNKLMQYESLSEQYFASANVLYSSFTHHQAVGESPLRFCYLHAIELRLKAKILHCCIERNECDRFIHYEKMHDLKQLWEGYCHECVSQTCGSLDKYQEIITALAKIDPKSTRNRYPHTSSSLLKPDKIEQLCQKFWQFFNEQ